MPRCHEHIDCDLVCSECGDYHCQTGHDADWVHVQHQDMPDDPEAYYNERAEQKP